MSTANKKIKLHHAIPCQEASILSKQTYIPCGVVPAVALVSNKDSYLYFMCGPCTAHNVRNRGASIVADVEIGRFEG